MFQRGLTALGQARKPKRVAREVIDQLADAHQALLLQIQLSGLTDKGICAALGIDKGQFSRIRTGSAHFPTRLLGALQDLTGNTALAQYLARQAGFELQPKQTTPSPWFMEGTA